ncbi:MAG: Trm112 family protein [Rubrivivax sp.]|nr:Trm112 family protein [Rubrivivax sp.]
MDHRLISLLVCPLCKGPLQLRRDAESRPTALVCPADRLAFPIRDGIPVMLESEAQPSEGPEGWAAPSPPPEGAKVPGQAGSP